jgi:ethanolamine ammonia-lyase small subunit
MTPEQFRKELDNFFAWTASGERPTISWYLSLEEWASKHYQELQANIESAKNVIKNFHRGILSHEEAKKALMDRGQTEEEATVNLEGE